ncbi:hypothetical protein [Micromonospora endolithica]|uniref:hypothetical protein n=1 Tax=Micromonospora endolithica TaxID=230091 RepID=UPI0011AD0F6D|nr:hypothetical protein [Micromonospora endolithica]TWJ26154.1 hypothetical protein JD76_06334 [Micromonospora endolithica]
MTTEPKRRRARRPPAAPESSTHGRDVPLDTKGREMCTDHQNVAKEQPCPTCGKCHAHSSQTGDPCRKAAVPGTGVCVSHGASAANVRKAAARRLLELVDPALSALGEIVRSTPKDSDRTRAATAILDRAGLGPSSKVEVETPKWEGVFAYVVNGEGDEVPPWRHDRYAQHDEDDPDE